MIGLNSKCDRCHSALNVIPGLNPNGVQFDNAVVVSLNGGYAMFVDNFAFDTGEYIRENGLNSETERLLCHDCAHKLCEFLGINPSTWHTHRPDLNEPDHYEQIPTIADDLSGLYTATQQKNDVADETEEPQ